MSCVTVELTSGAKVVVLEDVRVSVGKWDQGVWCIETLTKTSETTTDNAVVMTLVGKVKKGVEVDDVMSVQVYGARASNNNTPSVFRITGLNVESVAGKEEVKVPQLVKNHSRWRVSLL